MQELIVTREHMDQGLLPIRHLSYSAIRAISQSQNLFTKKYIRREFDEKEKPVFLIGKAVHSALEKYHGGRSGMFGEDYPKTIEETKIVARNAFDTMLEEARSKARERLGAKGVKNEETGETVYADKDGVIIDTFTIENEAIEWGKTITHEKALEQLYTAVVNYLSDPDSNNWIPRSVEISETVLFTDFDGDVMPVPLKGILDLIA